ncbi:MAG: hypothetical protein ACXVDA_26635 [Ktedonobacterales bacterium]
MTTKRYAEITLWLASLAYCGGFKRAARSYVLGGVCALWTADAELVMSGPLPSTVRRPMPPL